MRTALLLLLVLAPLPLAAQGLGDAAAREREKRAVRKDAPAAKVFTDRDLETKKEGEDEGSAGAVAGDSEPPGDEGSTIPSSPAATPPGTGGIDPAPRDPLEQERQERKLLEAEWRVRFANAREQLAVAEAASWEEVVRTEFVAGVPVQMKVREQVQTDELKQARQALADLEEEFRRTGLPPGWARQN